MPRPRSPRRHQLAAEQNHRCCYCGVRFDYDVRPDSPTIEHVRRLADGGQCTWENEVAACYLCNNSRGVLDAFAYYEHVQRRGRVRPTPRQVQPMTRPRRSAVQPQPPLTIKLVEYFELAYGPKVAARLIAGRGQGAVLRALRSVDRRGMVVSEIAQDG